MNTSHLCKYILTDDGLVGSYGNTAIALNQSADVIEFLLMDRRMSMKMVFQNYLHTRQRCVATTLTKAIDGDVQSLGTTQHCGKGV